MTVTNSVARECSTLVQRPQLAVSILGANFRRDVSIITTQETFTSTSLNQVV
jgi:hypothetical protein